MDECAARGLDPAHSRASSRDSIPRIRAFLAKIREKHGPKHRELGELGEIEKLFGDVGAEK